MLRRLCRAAARRTIAGTRPLQRRLGCRQRRDRRGAAGADARGCRARHLLPQRHDRRHASRRIIPIRPSRRTSSSCRTRWRASGCDLGIAFDGDGDRIGVVDGKGRILWGDQFMVLLAARDHRAASPGATIIADVKASQVLFDEIARMGGKPLMWRTGHSLIKTKMAETGAPLAGEMSGHIFFADRYYGYDDALYAAVRLLGILARGSESLAELRDRLPAVVNTPELRFPCAETRKFAVIDEVRARLQARRRRHVRHRRRAGADARTAGGCCAPRTRRTCWWRAPRPRTRPGSTGSRRCWPSSSAPAASRRRPILSRCRRAHARSRIRLCRAERPPFALHRVRSRRRPCACDAACGRRPRRHAR